MNRLFAILIVVFLSFFVINFSSCKKEEITRKATLTVVDENGSAVGGAKVTVSVNSKYANTYIDPRDPDNLIKEEVKYTSSNGVVEFEFDYDCVLEAKAEKEFYEDGVLIATKKGTATVVFKLDDDFEGKIIIK